VGYRHSRVSFLPQCFLSLSAAATLIDSIVGYLLYRSPISIDLVTQPPPASASGEAMTSASDLLCNMRARREDASGDLGHTEEDRRSPRLEFVVSEARAEEPARPEAPANAISSPAAVTEAKPTQAGETASAEAATSPPAISEIAAGDVAAASASSDPPGQEDTREAAAKAMEETSAPTRLLEPSELAAQTPSGLGLAPSAGHSACIWDRGWRGCWSPFLWVGLQLRRGSPRIPHHSGWWGVNVVKPLRLLGLRPRMSRGGKLPLLRPGPALGV
jgi:hypothetical protein